MKTKEHQRGLTLSTLITSQVLRDLRREEQELHLFCLEEGALIGLVSLALIVLCVLEGRTVVEDEVDFLEEQL